MKAVKIIRNQLRNHSGKLALVSGAGAIVICGGVILFPPSGIALTALLAGGGVSIAIAGVTTGMWIGHNNQLDTLPKTPSTESEKQGYAKIERKLDESNHTLAQMQKEHEMMRVKAQEQSDEQDRMKKMHERERADDIENQEELKSAIDKLDKKVSRLAKKDRSQRVPDHAIFQMPKPPTSKPDNRDDDKDPSASKKTSTP